MFKYKPGDICILHSITDPLGSRYNGAETTILEVPTGTGKFPENYKIDLKVAELPGREMFCAEIYLRFKPGQRKDQDEKGSSNIDQLTSVAIKLLEELK